MPALALCALPGGHECHGCYDSRTVRCILGSEVMGQEASPRIRSFVRWSLLAMAIAAVFLMPVEYRAGAQTAHPHALGQLVWEASNGTPRHHHVRKAIHPCVLAAHPQPMDDAAPMSGRDPGAARVDTGASGDVADPSTGTRCTTTVLAAALMPWLACLAHVIHPTRRQPTGTITLPASVALSPAVPPPRH